MNIKTAKIFKALLKNGYIEKDTDPEIFFAYYDEDVSDELDTLQQEFEFTLLRAGRRIYLIPDRSNELFSQNNTDLNRYAYRAVEPKTGESFFLIMTHCDMDCMNVFLRELSNSYPRDKIILMCDGAAWHKSAWLKIPDNIVLVFIPPYTTEMNPIEQIWKKLRKMGFKNEIFSSLQKVIDRLCEVIQKLKNETVRSITGRDWILSIG